MDARVWRRRRSERDRRMALDRERAEEIEALREQVRAREAVLSTIAEGIALFGPDGRVAYANPAARDLIGRRIEATIDLTPDALREAVVAAGRAGAPVTVEFETAGRIVEATALPSGQDIVVVARDVTAARRVERVRRDFVANASHELKTPVASIQALAETLRQAAAEDAEVLERFLARLEQEAVRLARLVTDLLDLSRLETMAPGETSVDLGRLVADEAERLRPAAEGAGIRLVVEAPVEFRIAGSEADLGLMVHNLLDNAIRYSPDGGEVRVTLRARDGGAEIRISDTGVGIPSRDLDRIFERFYRVDPARSRTTGGTGLGLSIVRHVAEAHGGDVVARSVLGAGSTFIVRLPASDEEEQDG